MQDDQAILIQIFPLLFLLLVWIPGLLFVLEKLSLRRRKRDHRMTENSGA